MTDAVLTLPGVALEIEKRTEQPLPFSLDTMRRFADRLEDRGMITIRRIGMARVFSQEDAETLIAGLARMGKITLPEALGA